jgi:hypothetical protein
MLDGLSDRQYHQLVADIHQADDEALLRRISVALAGALIEGNPTMTITSEQWHAAAWRKSDDSAQGNGSVYIARIGDTIGIRGDSPDPVVTVSIREWESFTGGVRAGDFDNLDA